VYRRNPKSEARNPKQIQNPNDPNSKQIRKLTPPEAETDVFLNRANLRVRLKNGAILGWSKFISGYVERDKKNVEKFNFCSQTVACLIEKRGNLPQIL